MGLLKNYIKLKATSLLESVVALSIISVCLIIAIMIYAGLFSSRSNIKSYSNNNKMYEVFFLKQINTDSLIEKYEHDNWDIQEETEGEIKRLIVIYKDSTQKYPERSYYISNEQ